MIFTAFLLGFPFTCQFRFPDDDKENRDSIYSLRPSDFDYKQWNKRYKSIRESHFGNIHDRYGSPMIGPLSHSIKNTSIPKIDNSAVSLESIYNKVMDKLKVSQEKRKDFKFDDEDFPDRFLELLNDFSQKRFPHDDFFWYDVSKLFFKWMISMKQKYVFNGLYDEFDRISQPLKIIASIIVANSGLEVSFSFKLFLMSRPELETFIELIKSELFEEAKILSSFPHIVENFYDNINGFSNKCHALKFKYFKGISFDINILLKYLILMCDSRGLMKKCISNEDPHVEHVNFLPPVDIVEKRIESRLRDNKEFKDSKIRELEMIDLGHLTGSIIQYFISNQKKFIIKDSHNLVLFLRKLNEFGILTRENIEELVSFESDFDREFMTPPPKWKQEKFEKYLLDYKASIVSHERNQECNQYLKLINQLDYENVNDDLPLEFSLPPSSDKDFITGKFRRKFENLSLSDDESISTIKQSLMEESDSIPFVHNVDESIQILPKYPQISLNHMKTFEHVTSITRLYERVADGLEIPDYKRDSDHFKRKDFILYLYKLLKSREEGKDGMKRMKALNLISNGSFWNDLTKLVFKWMIHMRQKTIGNDSEFKSILTSIETISKIIFQWKAVKIPLNFDLKNKGFPSRIFKKLLIAEFHENPHIFHSFSLILKEFYGVDDEKGKEMGKSKKSKRKKSKIAKYKKLKNNKYFNGSYDKDICLKYLIVMFDPKGRLRNYIIKDDPHAVELIKDLVPNEKETMTLDYFNNLRLIGPSNLESVKLEYLNEIMIDFYLASGKRFPIDSPINLLNLLKKLKEGKLLNEKTIKGLIRFKYSFQSESGEWNQRIFKDFMLCYIEPEHYEKCIATSRYDLLLDQGTSFIK